MTRAEREALFHKCAESMTSESITGWFLRSPGLQIWRDNVIDWLLWALFSVRNRDTNPEWEDELEYYTTVMGEYVGYPLVAGSSPEIQCLRLTMDPVPMVHRPFIWYMVRLPLCIQNPTLLNSCGSSSALSIPSHPSHSTSKASHTTIPANGFTSFPHAHSLHCSRVRPRTERPTYPTGTDHTARARSFRSYSSTASGSVSYLISHSSASSLHRIPTSASSPSRFYPFLCASPRRP